MTKERAGITFGLPTITGDLEPMWFEPNEITDDALKASCRN
jgi:hypothetical protein